MHGQPSSPIRGPWLRDARTADGCSAPMSSALVWTPQIRTGARVTPGRSLRGCRGGRGLRAGRMKRRVATGSAPPAPPACHRQPTTRGLAPVALDRWPRPSPSPLASSATPCGRSVHHRAVVQQADASARCRPRSCVAPGQRRREALGLLAWHGDLVVCEPSDGAERLRPGRCRRSHELRHGRTARSACGARSSGANVGPANVSGAGRRAASAGQEWRFVGPSRQLLAFRTKSLRDPGGRGNDVAGLQGFFVNSAPICTGLTIILEVTATEPAGARRASGAPCR